MNFVFNLGHGGRRDGAGRPARRAPAERLRRIDMRDLVREGAFLPPAHGEWWGSRSRLGNKVDWCEVKALVVDDEAVYLRVPDCLVDQRIRVVRSACGFGGSRSWFLCPGCDRRVAVLFLRDCQFRCRTCADVSYRTQRTDECGRAWIKQRRLESLLRPVRKGMHCTTYQRILYQIHLCEQARHAWLLRVTGRLTDAMEGYLKGLKRQQPWRARMDGR